MEPGLDKASELKPGTGWVAADIQGASDAPLSVSLEAAMRIHPDLALYGAAWVQPTEGRAGADVGARVADRFDVFAGGSTDTQGNWNAQAGVKWRF